MTVQVPWAILATVFFVLLAAWIGLAFVGKDFSFTLSFFPIFYGLVAMAFLRAAAGGMLFDITGPEDRLLGAMAGALVATGLLAWAANGILLDLPGDVRLFTLLVPLTLFTSQLLIWTTRLGRQTVRRLLIVLISVGVVNAVVSAATFICFDVLRILPTEIFFLNKRYPAILFAIGGVGWVRTPGIFESGASNGSFLLLTTMLTSCYTILGPGRRRPLAWWSLMLVQALLIAATLTRRNLLGLAVGFVICAVAALLLRRQMRYLVLSLFALGGGALWLIRSAPALTGSESMTERLHFWGENLFNLYPSHPEHLFVGFGITQAALPFLPGSRFQIVDNMYLGLLLYGGIALLLLFLFYWFFLLRANFRRVRAGDSLQWLAVANIILIVLVLVIGGFNEFIFNASEAFPYLIAVNISTRYVVSNEPAAVEESGEL